jgi:hypothetical protein
MNTQITFLGTTQEIHVCDRCGKSELNKTYAIEFNGDVYYLGSSCIAKKFEFASTAQVESFIKKESAKLNEKIRLEVSVATEELSKKSADAFMNDDMELSDMYYNQIIEIEKSIRAKYAV